MTTMLDCSGKLRKCNAYIYLDQMNSAVITLGNISRLVNLQNSSSRGEVVVLIGYTTRGGSFIINWLKVYVTGV